MLRRQSKTSHLTPITYHLSPITCVYGLSPSACTAYHAVHASSPDSAASPPLNFACPSGVTISAAYPPSSDARRNHCSTFDESGPRRRAHSRASSLGGDVAPFTVRRYVESWRSTASYSGSQSADPTGSSLKLCCP